MAGSTCPGGKVRVLPQGCLGHLGPRDGHAVPWKPRGGAPRRPRKAWASAQEVELENIYSGDPYDAYGVVLASS